MASRIAYSRLTRLAISVSYDKFFQSYLANLNGRFNHYPMRAMNITLTLFICSRHGPILSYLSSTLALIQGDKP